MAQLKIQRRQIEDRTGFHSAVAYRFIRVLQIAKAMERTPAQEVLGLVGSPAHIRATKAVEKHLSPTDALLSAPRPIVQV